MRVWIVVLAAVLLGGCASGGPAQLGAFTEADLSAAFMDARAHDDGVAADCWGTLLVAVRNVGNTSAPTIIGGATAWQAKRNLLGQGGGASQASELRRFINRGCAALFNEEGYNLFKTVGPAFGLPALP